MNDKKTPQKNEDKIEFSLPLNRRTLKYIAAIVLLISVVYVAVTSPEKIGSFISTVLGVLTPFLIGFCLAYVVNLLMRPLERFWNFVWHRLKNKKIVDKIRRPLCLVLSFLIVLGAIFAIVFMIIPALKDTVVAFVGKAPQYIAKIGDWYGSVVDFFARYNFDLPELALDLEKIGELVNSVITNYGNSVLDKTVTITASIVAAVVDIVLGVVFAIYLLAQKEKLCRQTNKVVHTLFKKKTADRMVEITALVNNVFTKFVTGQLTEAVIIGMLCFIGMLIFRMPYAGIVSVLVGFTALVPMFGAFIGTAIGEFLILLESPIKAVWFLIFIIIL